MLPRVSYFTLCNKKAYPHKSAQAFAVDISLFTGSMLSEKRVGQLHKLHAIAVVLIKQLGKTRLLYELYD